MWVAGSLPGACVASRRAVTGPISGPRCPALCLSDGSSGVLGTDGTIALKPLCRPHALNVTTHTYSRTGACERTHARKQSHTHSHTHVIVCM